MVEVKEIVFKDNKELYSDLVSFASNRYQAVHRWYPLVEGFSSELVRRIIGEQKITPKTCLDPFMGVGTTAVACQDLGIKCHGIENSPFFFDITRTKLRSDYDPTEFASLIDEFDQYLANCNNSHPLPELDTKTLFQSPDRDRWIFDDPVREGISDVLDRLYYLNEDSSIYYHLFKLALSTQLVGVSNVFRNGKCLSFRKNWQSISYSRKDVHRLFIDYCRNILLVDVRSRANYRPQVHNYINIQRGDSRKLIQYLPENSIDLVITSPPYLNSRDYTDIYRLELWILGYITKFIDEKKIRVSALTSHVQVRVSESESPKIPELTDFLDHLKCLNGTLWNKDIPNMVKGYFADMESIFVNLKSKLKKDAMVYINVSNSAYGNKICEVDTILAKIAETKGYEAIEIRTARLINSSKQQLISEKLRESIIVLKNTDW